MTREIISRKEAVALGLNRYFSGKPCAAGHVAWCYVKGGCVACVRLRTRAYEERNPEKAKSSRILRERKYRAKNWEVLKERKRQQRSKNLEKYREKGRLRSKDPEYKRKTLEHLRKVRAAYAALKELGVEL